MQCEDCGYMMSDFDEKCPRCVRIAPTNRTKSKSISKAPKPKKLPAPTQPIGVPDQHQQVYTALTETIFNGCLCCNNQDVRKVTAIVAQQTHSSTTERNSTKIGRYGYGVGMSTSFGSTTHFGGSTLAQMLAPPQQPTNPERPTISVTKREKPGNIALFSGLGFGCFGIMLLPLMGLIWLFSSSGAVGLFYTFFGLATFFVVSGVVANRIKLAKTEEEHQHKLSVVQQNHASQLGDWQRQCNVTQARWHLAMSNWDELYYCSRCDKVYNPQTGASATAHSMHSIL